MSPQLAALAAEMERATDGFEQLAAAMPEGRFAERPAPEKWSVAENVAHLNLTADAYLAALDAVLVEARRRGAAGARYRQDPVGWLLARLLAPGKGPRSRTPAAFVPGAIAPRDVLLGRFRELQESQIARIRASDGLPIDRVKVASPVSSAVRYNGYSAFTVLAVHQHRHLAQARAAWEVLRARA